MIFNNNDLSRQNAIISVKVIEKITLTQFIVEDMRQRQFQVESDGSYTIGEFVIIKNGVIIGKSRKINSVSNFVV